MCDQCWYLGGTHRTAALDCCRDRAVQGTNCPNATALRLAAEVEAVEDSRLRSLPPSAAFTLQIEILIL